MIDIFVSGFKNRFRDAARMIPGVLERELRRSGDRVVRRARSRARHDTGHMKRETRVLGVSSNMVSVGAMAYYSAYMDQGTRYVAADRWFTSSVEEETSQFIGIVAHAIMAQWSTL